MVVRGSDHQRRIIDATQARIGCRRGEVLLNNQTSYVVPGGRMR